MPYVNVHGVNLYYEEYGKGPAVILTPGGRVDCNGLRPLAALLSPKCRVILHDRRNCGRSDVVIGGELSEQHLWAEEMAGLLVQIGAAPAYAANGAPDFLQLPVEGMERVSPTVWVKGLTSNVWITCFTFDAGERFGWVPCNGLIIAGRPGPTSTIPTARSRQHQRHPGAAARRTPRRRR